MRSVVESVGRNRFIGFLTGEDRAEGRRIGFSIRMLDGRIGAFASLSSASEIRVGSSASYGVDLQFLEEVSVPAIRDGLNTARGQIIVIDEIGPMQLYSEKFKELVIDILGTDQAILLGSIVLRSLPWTDKLKMWNNVATFSLTPQNREIMTQMMILYLRGMVSADAEPSRA